MPPQSLQNPTREICPCISAPCLYSYRLWRSNRVSLFIKHLLICETYIFEKIILLLKPVTKTTWAHYSCRKSKRFRFCPALRQRGKSWHWKPEETEHHLEHGLSKIFILPCRSWASRAARSVPALPERLHMQEQDLLALTVCRVKSAWPWRYIVLATSKCLISELDMSSEKDKRFPG